MKSTLLLHNQCSDSCLITLFYSFYCQHGLHDCQGYSRYINFPAAIQADKSPAARELSFPSDPVLQKFLDFLSIKCYYLKCIYLLIGLLYRQNKINILFIINLIIMNQFYFICNQTFLCFCYAQKSHDNFGLKSYLVFQYTRYNNINSRNHRPFIVYIE